MADSQYYEVRCERCRTSFAPGTKRCIHCGAPLGRRLFGLGLDPTSTSSEEILAGGGEARAGAPASGLAKLLRAGLILLVVLSALGRACAE